MSHGLLYRRLKIYLYIAILIKMYIVLPYKRPILVFHNISCRDLIHVYTPARSLRSSSDTCILSTPNVKLKSYGQRSFAYHSPTAWGPTAWNSLPLTLRYQQESDFFKRALKTHLFSLN